MKSVLRTTSLLILVVSAIFADAKSELYPPRPPAGRRVITFGELRLAVNDIDGRFTIGTTDGIPLLYGFPQEGSTSHAHFFVDDSVVGTYTEVGIDRPAPAVIIAHPTMIGDAIVSRYDMSGVEFEQKLTMTVLGERTTVLIEYTATNNTLASVNAGLLLFFDTMIGDNDYAPIATEYGYFASEREFIAPSIPTYWQAFESSPWQPDDSLIGSGVLIGGAAVPPDRIVFGEFWNLHNTHWDYSITGDPYSDSALLMRWDARALAPGESRRMATYYGLGNVETSIGDITLSISGPEELFIESCTHRSPNPFPINVIASNATTLFMNEISARIVLPDGFFVVSGEDTASVTPYILPPGAMGTVSWTIALDDGYYAHDTVLCIEVEAWCLGSDTFSVDWCINVPGVDGRGPSADLIAPSPGAIIACDTLAVMIRLGDAGEVDESTIEITLDGITVGLADPRVTFGSNVLRCIVPSVDLEEGHIPITLGDIRDIHGCPLITDYSWNIYLDWTPPQVEFITPMLADTIDDPNFEVRVRLEDISGIEDTSLFWIFNGIVLESPVDFDGEFATLNPMSAGLVPLGLSYSTVCLDGIQDKVYGHCGPNFAEPVCIDFWTNIIRPSAEIIKPLPESFSACELQEIVVYMRGAGDEFDPASIVLTVNAVDHLIGDALVFEDSLLIFTPTSPFIESTEVSVRLTAETFAGLAISPLEWTFVIDLTPPAAVYIYPSGGSFSSHDEPVEFIIEDFGAGVDLSSLMLRVFSPTASALLNADSPELIISGDSVRFIPRDVGIALLGCDEIAVELSVADLAGYCPANVFENEYIFHVPCSPPIHSSPSVPESSFISCETLNVWLGLHDDEGIDEDAINISVNGIETALGSAFLAFESGRLSFAIPRDEFGDVIHILIDGVSDIFGNRIDHAIEFTYFFDATPPIVDNPSPEPSTVLGSLPDLFMFDVTDGLSGVDFSNCYVSLGGIRVDELSGLAWHGHSLSVPTDVLGSFSADSLRVCVHAVDNAIICGANSTYRCWTYRFDLGTPIVQLVAPPEGAVLGCPDQIFEFRILDDGGIDPETIILRAFHREWTLDDSELSLDAEILAFAPDLSFYHTGDICSVFVVEALDFAGNSITFPAGGIFTLDFTPPQVTMISPDTLYGPLQRLVWRIEDAPAGVSQESILLTINEIDFTLASPALAFDGEFLVFDPSVIEQWNDDAVIFLSVDDMSYICSNSANFNFTLLYMPVSTSARFITPHSGAAVACDPLQVEVFIQSDFGIDASSADISCNGVSLSLDDVIIAGDSLFAVYPVGAVSAGAQEISVQGITDTIGNEIPRICLSVVFDYEPPIIEDVSPANGYIYRGDNLIVSALVTDDYTGISLDRLSMTLNGLVYHLDSPQLQMRGDTLALDASEMGLMGAVSVRIEACDRTTLCGPNSSSLEWDFIVNSGGPVFELIEPFDGAITHIRNQAIVISANDPDGLMLSSIRLDINGEIHRLGEEMSFTGGVLEFRPHDDWQSGTEYHITIYGEDSFGDLTSADLGSFICDFDPPVVISTSPENNAVLDEAPEYISLTITDDISGFDYRSFAVEFKERVLSPGDYGILADSTGITINLESAGIVIETADSFVFKFSGISDHEGDFGTANIAEDFTLKFTVVNDGCVAVPRPFTPNGDGYYDVVTISTGLAEIAEISIYTLEGRQVRTSNSYAKWDWDGNDNTGRPMPPGIYTYTIRKATDGKVSCGGTIILAR